jgi:hypothetical protein
VKEDKMGRACSTNVERRNAYRLLVRKPEGKRSLERQRRKWVDNVKMDVRDGMDWIDLGQNSGECRTLANTVMNLRVA